ncbi:MFS transporter [Rummeliibacillus suwonensis]|uniref:MFS transporter n=1 Tax=Rummeliibacillus suwonensis TaxID=1306154 RepID=UPI001AAF93C4|nr:MFS transporter [Rummeliibacillus suwonensis]MBO2537751.1 MFS transporter [Rummeliibacillus suwonensis]
MVEKDKNALLKSNKAFRLFWTGQTISMFGSQITVIGLPLTAIYFLNANSTQMGIFQAVATIPFFLFSLFAGVWIDRNRKKNILIFCNLMTAASLIIIPLGSIFNFLNLTLFYIVVFIAGTFSMIFELAYLSFLPLIVSKKHLSEGNSKLEISHSVLEVSGPSISGYLISIVTAPIAIIIDIICYIVSSLFLYKIKIAEPKTKAEKRTSVILEIKEGLKVLLKHPILISLSGSTATLNFFRTAFDTLFLLFIIKYVGLRTEQIGIIIGLGSIGGLLGASISTRLSNKMGIGSTIITSVVTVFLGAMICSLAGGQIIVAITCLILGQILIGFGNTVYFISQVSLRQYITPMNLLGRVNASNRFITRGAMPLGGMFGGFLGSFINFKIAIFLISLGYMIGVIWLLISPVKRIKTLSDSDNFIIT